MSHDAHESRQHYGVTFATLAVAAISYALLQSLVAPALPTIEDELNASTTATTWILTAYLLSASVATPILGRLGDMFGKKKMLVVTMWGLVLGTFVGRAGLLDRRDDLRPRDPGHRRRRLPARFLDHPR